MKWCFQRFSSIYLSILRDVAFLRRCGAFSQPQPPQEEPHTKCSLRLLNFHYQHSFTHSYHLHDGHARVTRDCSPSNGELSLASTLKAILRARATPIPKSNQTHTTSRKVNPLQPRPHHPPTMPPKKGGPGGGGNEPAKKKVSVQDKTFGMKNKRGAVAQKQIKQIAQAQASAKTPDEKRKEADKTAREREKLAAEQAKREAAELLGKPLQNQKVPFGVDPKTVLCEFYRKGICEKGRRCKFSHDLDVGRRGEKRSLYTDMREGDGDEEGEEGEEGEGKKKDGMEDWDEEKLRQVVMSKHGNPKTTTEKVCKFFIDAVENQKYGWFWTCPNGGDKCMYRHSLPPGFVLKTKEQRAAEKALMDKSPLATLTLEDFLESERHKLTGMLTPVTPDSFATWKKDRLDKKAAELEAQKLKEATGRALFEKGDWEVSDDEDGDGEGDGAWNIEALRRETEEARMRREDERLAGEGVGGGGEQVNGEAS